MDTIIVGGGTAGITTALKLAEAGHTCTVLEADSILGGRVRVAKLGSVDIDAGAFFVHGSKDSMLMKLVEEQGWEYSVLEWPDFFYVNKKLVDAKDRENLNPKIKEALDLMENLPEMLSDVMARVEKDGGKELPFETFLEERGLDEEVKLAVDACFANDYGTSLNRLGLKAVAQELSDWSSGEEYILLSKQMTCVIDTLVKKCQDLKTVSFQTNAQVVSISVGKEDDKLVKVTLSDGRVFEAKSCVVTVPLPILQQNLIDFDPPLSPRRKEAMTCVKVDNAIKIVVSFSERFWPVDLYDVVIPGGFVPEFWFAKNDEQWYVMGFAAGDVATRIAQMSKEEAAKALLDLVDEIFGSESDPKPATSRALHSLVFDWEREAVHVRGAYTSPVRGSDQEDRIELAKPKNHFIFFAGEATHEGQNACVHGAMETAERAAKQVLEFLAN